MTQIMDLLNLAPEIQEAILLLSSVERGKDEITKRTLRVLMADSSWIRQPREWASAAARKAI